MRDPEDKVVEDEEENTVDIEGTEEEEETPAIKTPYKPKTAVSNIRIPLTDIHLREHWNREKLGDIAGLVQSIKNEGQIVPIIVNTEDNGNVYLVDGRRRFAALTEAGVTHALVSFTEVKDELDYRAKAIVANVARRENAPMEIAREYVYMKENGKTSAAIAAMVGSSVQSVTQYVHLVERLPEDIQKLISAGKVNFSQGRQLCRFDANEPRQNKAMYKILEAITKDGANQYWVEDAVARFFEKYKEVNEAKKAAEEATAPPKKEEKKGKDSKKDEAPKKGSTPKATEADYTAPSTLKMMKIVADKKHYSDAMAWAEKKRQRASSAKRLGYFEGVLAGLKHATGLESLDIG